MIASVYDKPAAELHVLPYPIGSSPDMFISIFCTTRSFDVLIAHVHRWTPWLKHYIVIYSIHTSESGPSMDFKRDFRQLWTKYYAYKGSALKDVHLLMAPLSNPSLNDPLAHKKPSRSLFRKLEV